MMSWLPFFMVARPDYSELFAEEKERKNIVFFAEGNEQRMM
jgi:hypothetical protein